MLRLMAVSTMLLLAPVGAIGADGPFDPVPKNHWAYHTVERFNCDWCWAVTDWDSAHMRTISRYEFAVATGRVCIEIADSEKARRKVTSLQLSGLIRLMDEFRPELAALGADVDAMKRDLPSVFTAARPELLLQNYAELADMSQDHWAYGSMKQLYELGFFEGVRAK